MSVWLTKILCVISYLRKMNAQMKSVVIVLMVLMVNTALSQSLPKFDIQGHRGARGLKPENTIPAFIAGLNEGITTVELDLAITKDKQVILSHETWMSPEICSDSVGNRINEKEKLKYNIYQMSYDQIKTFDCGSVVNKRFPKQDKIKVSKPLLSDAIVAIENHIKNATKYEVDYNIEIKSMPEGDNKFHPTPEEFSDLVFNLVNQYLPLDRVVIQSFDFRVLQYWHTKYPEVRLAALVENKNGVDQNLKRLGFIPSIYSPEYTLLSKEDVKALREKNIRVIPWTVNKVSTMLSMKGLGVDGFITDYPDSARRYKMTLNIPFKGGSQ